MATADLSLHDDEIEQLVATAAARQLSLDALVTRWVRERLAHERERMAGGGEARSPRARRDPDARA